MSRSKNSRRGSRKSRVYKRSDCSCFLCASASLKKRVLSARALERDQRNDARRHEQYPDVELYGDVTEDESRAAAEYLDSKQEAPRRTPKQNGEGQLVG